MKRPPRKADENIFAGTFGIHILVMGLLIGALTLGTQAWSIHVSNSHWQTMTFTVLCFAQLAHVVAIRSSDRSIFSIGFLSNKPMVVALIITSLLQLMTIYIPFFNKIFHTQPLSMMELAITLAISSLVFWAIELRKLLKTRRKHAEN